MSGATRAGPPSGAVTAALGQALRGLLTALAGRLTGGAEDRLARLTGRLEEVAGGGRSGGPPRSTVVVEDLDVGVPVSTAYERWTRFEDFPSFMRGVESVEQRDDVESVWRGKVGPSRRTWRARVHEQVPDRRIAWTSEGEKGSVDGVVSFHPLADDLTRILVTLEYHPRGPVERTANLWRAPGRRARLDLKQFRRFLAAPDGPGG